ncbi:MAG: hypothetical protein OXH02_14545 [Gemmatimonadetes bacterium]|nr:hypothetical protein [Gemmatimonadota bacterium]
MNDAIDQLPEEIRGQLRQAGRLADESGLALYLVGGTVRDLLLGRARTDIDLAVEGDGMEFAARLARASGGRCAPNPRFLTATVEMPEGHSLDVATARSETYERPGALPRVASASMDVDLARRDFTINAMAVSLNGRSFGELVDPFEGGADLRKKRVRILHDRSFIDDPTRLFRAVRFEQRLRFRLERGTERRFREAVAQDMIGHLSGPRLLEQLKLVCFEPDPWLVFNRLEGLEVLRAIHPALGSDEGLKTLVREISPSGAPASPAGSPPTPAGDGWWILYLVALFGPHRAETLQGVVDRLKPNRRLRKAIEDMSRWSAVERAVASGEIDTPADFFHAVRSISEDTMLFVTLTHPDEGMRKRCETYYHQHRHLRLSIDGGTLKDLGIAEGPAYGRILEGVLSMKINGEIGNAEEERSAARDLGARLHRPES